VPQKSAAKELLEMRVFLVRNFGQCRKNTNSREHSGDRQALRFCDYTSQIGSQHFSISFVNS